MKLLTLELLGTRRARIIRELADSPKDAVGIRLHDLPEVLPNPLRKADLI
ncbi:MAG: hypothetical protein N2A42_08050 [Luteolibacter sp.]